MNYYMISIDLKDRRILYELDNNSRQSTTKIGKKVGLHKNVVLYRINRLLKNGVIQNFYTVINSYKLGYESIRFYINFRHITPDIRKEIVEYFVNNSYTWWVGTFEGSYDLAIVIWVKNLKDFHALWEKTLNKYHKYFRNQIFSNYIELRLFRESFLLDEYDKLDREQSQLISGGKIVETDELDKKILRLLSYNARMQISEIAKKIDSTIDTVKSRIDKLNKNEVILAYRVNIDYTKLGYQFFKVNIDLNDYKERGRMINYIKYNPHLVMIDKAIGYYDLELNFWVKNLVQFHDIMDDMTINFPNAIRNYEYVHDPIKYKMIYLPQ